MFRPDRGPFRMWRSMCAGLAFTASVANAQTAATVRPLQYTRVVLPNGLVALFNEDRSSPLIGVGVSYHVGGKDEPPGHTGLAHLCEHMMFEGSPNVPPGQFIAILTAIGGTSSRMASTSEDRTFYWATIPSSQLETLLWLESDRMADPFGAMDSTRMSNSVGVIRGERQQGVDNIPFGSANDLTLAALYSGGEWPYRGPLGPMDDLNRATFSQMKDFCRPYYVPNNAVIALSGDFETAKARALVEKYFGTIKRGGPVTHPKTAPTVMPNERRMVLEDSRARQPRLRLAWAGAGFADPDKLPLNALASVIQGDETSGLTKALMHDRQLATFVNVFHADFEKGGVFEIEVVPRGTTSLTVIENVVDSVIAATQRTAPAERVLRRFKNSNASVAITNLQQRWMRADTLSQGESWANDPVVYAKQVNTTSRLTPSDVQRIAERYLKPGRLVISMVPAGKLDLISKPERPYEKPLAVVPSGGGGR